MIPVVFGLLVLLAAWRLWAARCKRNEGRIDKLGPADSAGRQEDWAQHLSPKRLDGSRYRAGLVRAMRRVDDRLGPQPFSAGTYDFCLRLAFGYSILAVLFVWLATGMSTGEILARQPDARKEDGNLIERVSLLVFFSTSICIYLYCFRGKQWWLITRIIIYRTISVLGAPFRVVSYAILIVITLSVALKFPGLFYSPLSFSRTGRYIANAIYLFLFFSVFVAAFFSFRGLVFVLRCMRGNPGIPAARGIAWLFLAGLLIGSISVVGQWGNGGMALAWIDHSVVLFWRSWRCLWCWSMYWWFP